MTTPTLPIDSRTVSQSDSSEPALVFDNVSIAFEEKALRRVEAKIAETVDCRVFFFHPYLQNFFRNPSQNPKESVADMLVKLFA